jgi:uncharacterized protein (TIGR04255 family)
MSKLPKAPLIEVIFELHWPSQDLDDLNKFDLSLGAMFVALRKDFPHTINLRPDNQIPLGIFIDKPTHRFTQGNFPPTDPKNYPLYQLGPGLLTVNTVDENYDWDRFSALILEINRILSDIYQFDPNKELTLALKYLDFYKVNFEDDVRTLYQELFKFKIDLGRAVPKEVHPILMNIESGYKTANGTVNFSLKRVKMAKPFDNTDGIIFENGIQLKIKAENYTNTLNKWLTDAHEDLSAFFKEITKGKTYESFK